MRAHAVPLRLEVNSQCELDNPRAIERSRDQSKGAALRWKPVTQGSIGIAESRAIENIEHVTPNLSDEPFVYSCVLDDPKVLV